MWEVSAVFVRNDAGEYCFVFEKNPKYERRGDIYLKWGPPAERIEPGETPGEAAIRAMAEEAGIRGRLLSRVPFIVDVPKDNPTSRFHYFTAELTEETGGGDHETGWFAPGDIRTRGDVAPYVPRVMEKMSLL